jgi:hypothetical protein
MLCENSEMNMCWQDQFGSSNGAKFSNATSLTNRISYRYWTEMLIADHLKEWLHRIIMILRITMFWFRFNCLLHTLQGALSWKGRTTDFYTFSSPVSATMNLLSVTLFMCVWHYQILDSFIPHFRACAIEPQWPVPSNHFIFIMPELFVNCKG